MVATITASICTTFNAFSMLSWVVTSYAFGACFSRPLAGHLTDIYGRRAGLAVCFAAFGAGTLICGLSPSVPGGGSSGGSGGGGMALFLTGRALQGLGGGPLASIVGFVESDIVPIRRRPVIEGVGNICYGATLALGGVYGGAVSDAIGWRWAFLIQVPVIALDAAVVLFVLGRIAGPSQQKKKQRKRDAIDYVGCFLVLLTMGCFQYGMNTGSGGGASRWTAPAVIASLAVAGAGLAALLYWDGTKASNPVIPVRQFADRTIASSQFSALTSSAATGCVLYYVPVHLQALGASAQQSGTRFIPYAVTLGAGSVVFGYAVQRLGRYYAVNVLVQLLCAAAAAGLCTMTADTPAWAPFVYLGILGAGYGGSWITRLMGLLTSVDKKRQAVVQAASGTIMSVGFTVGIVVATAIFQKLSRGGLQGVLLRARGEDDEEMLERVLQTFGRAGGLSVSTQGEITAVYLGAVRCVFYLVLGLFLAAAVSSLLMKNNPLLEKEADESESEAESGRTDKGSV